MDEQLKSNLSSGTQWLRLVFMALFAVLLYLAFIVFSVLVVVQFLFALITGKDNVNLRHFGDALSQYIFQILQYLSYNSWDKPFPFAEWPQARVQAEEPVAASEPATASADEPVADDGAASGPENSDNESKKAE